MDVTHLVQEGSPNPGFGHREASLAGGRTGWREQVRLYPVPRGLGSHGAFVYWCLE